MTLRVHACTLVVLTSFVLPCIVAAQEALSVSVTPPLFQLSIGPGENFSSSVKVVNSNSRTVTYYARAMDFEATGELGKGDLIPLIEEPGAEAHSFSPGRWIELPSGPIIVGPGDSAQIPFTVHVPPEAEPGGHYAAITVGTQPDSDSNDGPNVSVSTFVTSILMVRIQGDIQERGRIREFVTARRLYQIPTADFVLRFENLGNVHLRPQGTVSIFNMWGKERGTLEINQKGMFGNVLPGTIRKFEFSWTGEGHFFDIGRYSAITTLSFGEDQKQNTSAKTYFWVIPLIPVAITLGSIVSFLLLLFWFIKRYIRRALALEHMHMKHEQSIEPVHQLHEIPTLHTLVEPLREGVIDLRNMTRGAPPVVAEHPQDHENGEIMTPAGFVRKYRLFFLFIIVCVFAVSVAAYFFEEVLVPARDFNVSEVHSASE